MLVHLGGSSCIVVVQVVPEGGTIGPAAYTLVPDVLVKELLGADHGLGVDVNMPPAWAGHVWVGTGSPDPALVHALDVALRDGASLPSIAALEESATLEASALRALDHTATLRVCAVLHADDPVLVDSSLGGLRGMVDITSRWCCQYKVAFHVGSAKTVVQAAGDGASAALSAGDCGFEFRREGVPPASVAVVWQHKWLGLPWRADLDFVPALIARIKALEVRVADLASLVADGSLPLCMAADMFESKVDGAMRPCRWLYAIAWQAQSLLDSAYEEWAKALLGSPRWRSAAVATSELGWRLSGYDRAVLDMASKRAQLWRLPQGDIYGDVFRMAHSLSGPTWAKQSAEILASRCIQDWPEWSSSGAGPSAYLRYVRGCLEAVTEAKWRIAVSTHTRPRPYLQLRPAPARDLHEALTSEYPWSVLVAQRSVSRCRAGLLDFGHRAGRRTAARVQTCILCGRQTGDAATHVLSMCEELAVPRSSAWGAAGIGAATRKFHAASRMLNIMPGVQGFAECVLFFKAAEARAACFWASSLGG